MFTYLKKKFKIFIFIEQDTRTRRTSYKTSPEVGEKITHRSDQSLDWFL